ncbi:MAG: EamA family transporter [Nannocystis sp.]|nr:EamA family transporter [Nannocystis sp.]MBK8263285.1 EamA family transporter [Nannocystis sp.]
MAVIGYILLCLIWGSTWLAIKIGLDAGMPPLLGAATRFLIAALILVPLALRRSPQIFRDRAAWRLALQLGGLSFGLGYGCTYVGGLYVPSGLGSLTFGFFPFWVAVLAHFFLGDRLTFGKIASIALGIAGLVVLYSGSLRELGADSLLGVAIITASVLIQGFPQIWIKRDGARIPAAFLSGVGMLCGSAVLFTLAGLRGEWASGLPLSAPVLLSIAYLAVFGSVVTFLIYYSLLRRLSATLMALIAILTPPIALLLGFVFKAERLGALTLTGGAMVLVGVLLFQRAERRARA